MKRSVQLARWMSRKHLEFVALAHHQPMFSKWHNILILLLLPLLPGTKIMVVIQGNRVIAGMMLSRCFISYWAHQQNRTGQRKRFFQQMKTQQRSYASYAVVAQEHRRQGVFSDMIQSLEDPVFMTCMQPQLADAINKLGAQKAKLDGKPIPNLCNGGKTVYQVIDPKKGR